MSHENPTLIEELTKTIKVLGDDLNKSRDYIKQLEQKIKECCHEQERFPTT